MSWRTFTRFHSRECGNDNEKKTTTEKKAQGYSTCCLSVVICCRWWAAFLVCQSDSYAGENEPMLLLSWLSLLLTQNMHF